MTTAECRQMTESQIIAAMMDLNRRMAAEGERPELKAQAALLKSELFRR